MSDRAAQAASNSESLFKTPDYNLMSDPIGNLLDHGLLKVDDKTEIYWEKSGNPDGKCALYLHGGPGSGLGSGSYRELFDPAGYCLIGIDQRGCGRSRPLAIDDLNELSGNTTQALIRDIEALRHHLAVERWLVAGISWGSTLALAYAQSHPARVSELVLMAVTTTSRAEVDWITEGVGCLFPEAWDQFERASGRTGTERPVDAYARRLASSDADDRRAAARCWNDWESTHVSLDPNWAPHPRRFDEIRAANFATLVTHYWANDGFLRGGDTILERMDSIQHIPAVLIHGRRDFSGPLVTAWRLHQAWPNSRLLIIEQEGHGGPMSRKEMRLALDAFASSR
ncbi:MULTISPECIES: prolyl aminopeptidase [Rhizobium]|uniref:Proline iminopeptidase n=1 Tax=Rhizobium rhododendri TaxID=2506430 RepID=A0ABY8II74_9HYPH|nr:MULTISPECIES: prolyl aminopeptidase [Rhizobium]MBZ5761029.1 prolyl aminopeptidase [Rhizobium sp. VS19-DR96]MBZ5767283.1 prolyl aminopeptidase [Rhizobium sp. VS19-DR129.2]MBZ5773428.1 prolyl aminopeptidase [Rhizobium sp. VS19-DRK62.2]MBZ5785595.1 prolyl aminopeptidase [Rhizobium sp. VS19-DR121]MBZ5802416.1 prolyl aminopeptidase [Rhizobium sp. VS19-DR181]